MMSQEDSINLWRIQLDTKQPVFLTKEFNFDNIVEGHILNENTNVILCLCVKISDLK